jgi:CRISPR/Cas system-associated protein Cas7 (RAMP superfamily)
MLLAEYLEEAGAFLCPACRVRNARRAAAAIEKKEVNGDLEEILNCALCDVHGFLVTPKKATNNSSQKSRQRLTKHSLIEYSFYLALPDQYAESSQIHTRTGDAEGRGQMLMKLYSRSGQYAFCVRYKAVGIGVDTEHWLPFIEDSSERLKRHMAILRALRDQVLSPGGATTSRMLPHLSGVIGAVAVRTQAGRAPLYSPLQDDFIGQLQGLGSDECLIFPFYTIVEFNDVMRRLISKSDPCMPKAYQN